jgi:hypothetical protein
MIQLGGSQVAIHFGALRIEKASCDCMLPLGISDGQQRGHAHTSTICGLINQAEWTKATNQARCILASWD